MTTYRYTGPHSGVTLRVNDADNTTHDQDVLLWNDQLVDLPSDHEFVQGLLAQGLLVPETLPA